MLWSLRLVELLGPEGPGVVDMVRVGPRARSIRVDRSTYRHDGVDSSLYVSRGGRWLRCEKLSLRSGRTRFGSERVLLRPAARRFYRDLQRGLPVPGERLWWILRDGKPSEWWRRLCCVRFLESNGNWVSGVGRGAELLALMLMVVVFGLSRAPSDIGDRFAIPLFLAVGCLVLTLVVDILRVSRRDRE